jgi:transposase
MSKNKTKNTEGLTKLNEEWAELKLQLLQEGNIAKVRQLEKYVAIIEYHFLGFSSRKIAELVGISNVAVHKTIHKYKEAGTLRVFLNEKGRPRYFDALEFAEALRKADFYPSLLKALTHFEVKKKGTEEKAVFVQRAKIWKLFKDHIEGFLGVELNRQYVYELFNAILYLEFVPQHIPYEEADVNYWLGKKVVEPVSKKLFAHHFEVYRARNRRLKSKEIADGFFHTVEFDIKELRWNGSRWAILHAKDLFTGEILPYYRVKEIKSNVGYNKYFDRYDIGILLYELFTKIGKPQRVKFDRGAQFLAKFVVNALKFIGVKPDTSKAYHAWQKTIERSFGEEEDWKRLLEAVPEQFGSPENINEVIDALIDSININRSEKPIPEKNYAEPVPEEKLFFAFLEKETRKIRNGFIDFEGVTFDARSLYLNKKVGLNTGRGRKKENLRVLVAVHPENLTRAFVFRETLTSEYQYDGKCWEFVGVVYPYERIEHKTLTEKRRKQRAKRALERKKEKAFKEYRKALKQQEEELKAKVDPVDVELEKLLNSKKETKKKKSEEKIEVPLFFSGYDALLWLKDLEGKGIDPFKNLPKEKLEVISDLLREDLDSGILPLDLRAYARSVLQKVNKAEVR